jgi:uncharacterized protein (TIGR03435 family)
VKRLLMSLGLLTILVGVCAKAQDSTKSTSALSMMEPALVPAYEVATIKPSKPDEQGRGLNFRGRHLVVTNMTVEDLITLAYNIHPKQLTGGPGWLTVEHYDMDILTDHDDMPNLAWARGVARKLLADRFALKSHEETKELSAYVLTVSRTGPKLTKSASDPGSPPGLGGPPGMCMVRNGSMAEFTQILQGTLDRPVLDQTGLKDRYDFTLRWAPDESQYGGRFLTQNNADNGTNTDPLPSLFTAMQEQIGLRLDAMKALVKMFVVDSIDRPSAN